MAFRLGWVFLAFGAAALMAAGLAGIPSDPASPAEIASPAETSAPPELPPVPAEPEHPYVCTEHEFMELTPAQSAVLERHDWGTRAGSNMAVWVSVDEQRLRLVEDGHILWEVPCSTAAAGTGSQADSNRTPLGWHSVREKLGGNAEWGQVFKSRQPTRTIWQPGDDTEEDLVLTRILWLSGEEPGKNKGGLVDSYLRYIYIHGTNGEEVIGKPASHGCIRLLNDDVITAFERIPKDTLVLITEEQEPQPDGTEQMP